MRPVTRNLGTGLAAILLIPILVRPAAAADGTVEFPLAHSKLSLVDGGKPNGRRIVLKARFDMHDTLENPLFAGATLRVVGGSPTDGDSGLIQLMASKWRPLGKGKTGYRYEDKTGTAGGIRHIMVKQGNAKGAAPLLDQAMRAWPAVSDPKRLP